MGHHPAEFTLWVYAHLIPGDEPEALDLEAELPGTRLAFDDRAECLSMARVVGGQLPTA